MPVDEKEKEARDTVKAFRLGMAWGRELNRRDRLAEIGENSVYPPPFKVGGWVNVDPAVFNGDIDALQPDAEFVKNYVQDGAEEG